MGDDGQPGNRYERFCQGYANTRGVPVTVRAHLADGTRQTFIGTYQVRRVNAVDGASAEQRRWHLDSAKLSQQH